MSAPADTPPDLPMDWPHRAASRSIAAVHQHWHVQDMGPKDDSAPTLLLIHGAGGSVHSWAGLAPILAQHYRVIALDVAGHGFSQKGRMARAGLEDIAADILALATDQGWQVRAVIGHSAGAAIALRLAKSGYDIVLHCRARREEAALRADIEERIIDFLEIDHIRHAPVSALPYGLQKRVEMARALAMQPQILMLDEPVAGMNREETEDMARFILDVREEWGVTVLMVEHDMGMVMDLSDRVVVMDYGKKIGDGTPEEVRNNQAVIDAYLGVSHE